MLSARVGRVYCLMLPSAARAWPWDRLAGMGSGTVAVVLDCHVVACYVRRTRFDRGGDWL